MKKLDFLTGSLVVDEIESPINGKVSVIRSLAFGTYLQAANLTQSGGIIYDVWKKPLNKVVSSKQNVERVLIVGLGGGTVVKLVKKFWPKAEILGLELDQMMIDLGKKYLGLSEKEVKIKVGDAYNYLTKKLKNGKTEKYDLVLVDTYVGDVFPEKFESDKFLKSVKKVLKKGGIAIFNRLYYDEKRSLAVKFEKKLEKLFKKVTPVYPEANVMFVCTK
jgi:spermidine synthase